MKNKDKEKRLHRFRFHHIPKSDPTSPAVGTSKDSQPPLLNRVIASSRERSPSHTAISRFGFNVDSILKPKINRTASAGSGRKRQFTLDESASLSNIKGTHAPAGTPQMAASPTIGTPPTGVLTPKASRVSSATGVPFQAPKSKFKFAHESFRARMFQEQHGFEPVFMTKKRTGDTKFSEFKGGDLNKYTARSYTIKNGNEVFGANIQNEFGICGFLLTALSYILIVFTLPFSACLCIKVVQEYERAVIFRLGRLMPGGARGPGIFFVVPCIDSYRKVDLRVLSFEVPPQEILSKDSVTVAVDAVVYFRISNATISVTNVEDCSRSTKLLAQTTLRNILGTKTLAEMLSDREAVSLLIQDVRLPVQLQRAMATEAEAAREARAKVIVAEGEQKASRALKEAAEVIAQSPSALQLRYLQTLNSIAAEKNSTIVFPLPVLND
ncbi:PHB domain-containing protein [Aphelenchoides besseyi]|nr:PHB domain-containing protein [Aphelenchoides besseyi]